MDQAASPTSLKALPHNVEPKHRVDNFGWYAVCVNICTDICMCIYICVKYVKMNIHVQMPAKNCKAITVVAAQVSGVRLDPVTSTRPLKSCVRGPSEARTRTTMTKASVEDVLPSPKIDMEAHTGPCTEDSSLIRGPSPLPCCFGGVGPFWRLLHATKTKYPSPKTTRLEDSTRQHLREMRPFMNLRWAVLESFKNLPATIKMMDSR